MELRLAGLECERPELDVTVPVFDDGVERDIGRDRQTGGDFRVEHQFARIVTADDLDRLDRRVASVQAEIVEVVAGPLA